MGDPAIRAEVPPSPSSPFPLCKAAHSTMAGQALQMPLPSATPTPGSGDQLLPRTHRVAGTVCGPSQCSPHGGSSMTYVPWSTADDDPAAPSSSSSWMGAWFQAPCLPRARGLHSRPPPFCTHLHLEILQAPSRAAVMK